MKNLSVNNSATYWLAALDTSPSNSLSFLIGKNASHRDLVRAKLNTCDTVLFTIWCHLNIRHCYYFTAPSNTVCESALFQ